MSNFLGPATVTAALRLMLSEMIAAEINNFTVNVTSVRPDDIPTVDDRAYVNLYLYQVSPNATWRNADLPIRNGRGQLVNKPRAAVDLHYLITFVGDDADLEPQRMMGSTVHILHQQPVLTRSWIDHARAHADYASFLGDSDLGNEIEQVKMTPTAFSLEELSKLWSVFFQTPYNLSIAYVATVVFIEPMDVVRRTRAVLSREVDVVPTVGTPAVISPSALDDLALWLRSDRGVSFDDAVSPPTLIWEDQSGFDRHATQDDLAQQPRHEARGIGRFPVFFFDGVDDRLGIDWQLSAAQTDLTVCAVVRTESDGLQAVLSFDDDAHWELLAQDGAGSPRPAWITTDGAAHTLTATQATNDTQWHVLYVEHDAAAQTKRIYVDGADPATAAAHAGTIGTATGRFGIVGASSAAASLDGGVDGKFFHGDLAEIIVYDRLLTDTERGQLEQYFASRYGNV
ncbi:MAG: Pvc16 family protein [Ardenticatenaceae bacterium]|nr:Pvc16 family protein [Ardenticatenaceae bacterium]